MSVNKASDIVNNLGFTNKSIKNALKRIDIKNKKGEYLGSNLKYDNGLNNIIFPSFTASELDIFHMICENAQNQLDNLIYIPLNKIFQTLNQFDSYKRNSSKEDNIKKINDFIKKLSTIKYISKETNDLGKRIFIYITFFPTCILDESSSLLKVALNKEYLYMLNGVQRSFTMLEMPDFFSLNTKASKFLYKQLKQFAAVGYYIETIEILKVKLDAENYQTGDFFRKVINPAIIELDHIFGNITVRKIKEGRKIKRVEFIYNAIVKQTKESKEIEVSSNLIEQIKNAKLNNYVARDSESFLLEVHFAEYLNKYKEKDIIKALKVIYDKYHNNVKNPKHYFEKILSEVSTPNNYKFVIK